jgi:alkaline phosphatase D
MMAILKYNNALINDLIGTSKLGVSCVNKTVCKIMKRIYIAVLFIIATSTFVLAQNKKNEHPVRSGPMLGYSEMRETAIWLQMQSDKPVYIEYYKESFPSRKYRMLVKRPEAINYFVVQFLIDSVDPGTQYVYDVYVDRKKAKFDYPTTFKTQTDWMYKDSAPNFSVAAGSCVYVNEPPFDRKGDPYGGDYFIFDEIYKRKPDLMLWLGDNTYFRPADWGSRTGMMKRYTHDRSIPELQPLLASAHNYAIWDDHDFGPNDASYSFYNKAHALELFKLFWANQTYGQPGMEGIMSQFTYGDVDFFLVDNRFYRTEKRVDGSGHILGEDQENWLIDALKFSRATYKIVCIGGQFLNTARIHENHSQYAVERNRILQRINNDNIRGVVFLTGDRHHSEISRVELPNGNVVFDITTSPLTSGVNMRASEEFNMNRVQGSMVMERNFALLEFVGDQGNRKLVVRIINNKGIERFKYEIKQSDLTMHQRKEEVKSAPAVPKPK